MSVRGAAACGVLLAASAFAAPPYLFRVEGVRDAGVGSSSPPLVLTRLLLDGGVADLGEGQISVEVYMPPGGDVIVFAPNIPTGLPSRALTIFPGTASTAPFFVRLPSVGTFTVVVDAGVNAAQPFAFDVNSFPVSHHQSFEFSFATPDAGDFIATGEFHNAGASDPRATISYSAAAAHEGDSGYSFSLSGPATPGSGYAAGAERFYLPMGGDLHFRSWVRTRAQNGLGEVHLWNVHCYGPHGSPVADYIVSYPEGRVLLSAHDVALQYERDDAGAVATADGGWFLAEMAVLGMNTDAGQVRAYVNGQLAARIGPLDWTGLRFKDLQFATPWVMDKLFVGEIDFDELAVTSVPPPTFVRVLGPPVVSNGACTQMMLTLTGAEGLPTPAYRTHALGVQLVGNASAGMYADAVCTTPLANPPAFEPGVVFRALYVRANALGSFTLSAVTKDLLGTSHTFTAIDGGVDAGADAGADGGVDGGAAADGGVDGGDVTLPPVSLGVGCGCQSAPAALSLLLLGLFALWRRPRR